ncbi:hypothetical protein K440DRAFT_627445 [Wilcoxina mikolae CBS 423.85]|nr:hypothetical protein K440DRAFT_627445 [Wilcoxina mikolae CBS 423.85]
MVDGNGRKWRWWWLGGGWVSVWLIESRRGRAAQQSRIDAVRQQMRFEVEEVRSGRGEVEVVKRQGMLYLHYKIRHGSPSISTRTNPMPGS